MIGAQSKSKYYNPHDIDKHTPNLTATDSDKIGLICAIVVNVNYLFNVRETIYNCFKGTVVIAA
jgi:hypothetical protein